MPTPSDRPFEIQPRRGYPIAAWCVIVTVVTTAFSAPLWLENRAAAKKQTEDVMLEMEARQLVAAAQLDHSQGPKMFRGAEPKMKKGPDAFQLRVLVALAGELVGPDEALRQLHGLDPPAEERPIADLLERLYGDYAHENWDAPSLSDADRAELRDKLGWFGELALNPREGPNAAAREAIMKPLQQSLYFLIGGFAGFLALGFVGLNLLIGMAVLVALRKARLHFTTGSPNGGIYAETFALWLVMFIGLALGASLFPAGKNKVLMSGLVALSSLSALAWPVIRGVPWQTVRREIGLVWTDCPLDAPLLVHEDPPIGFPHRVGWGSRPVPPKPAKRWAILEPLFGLCSYVGTLPLLLVGALLTLGLIRLAKIVADEYGDPFDLASDPNHPIAGLLLTADWWGKLQVIFVASVGAPIVEETMFRGVLYRHLREATGGWAHWLSVLASAVVVSFVFAVIHPQGMLGVPALMSLAIGFSLAHEWRGSLVAAMVAHGLNNLMVTMMLLMSVW